MALAFWNNGSPRVVRPSGSGGRQRLTLPNGDILTGTITADPEKDLYNYVETGQFPNRYQYAGPTTYTLEGDTITAARTVLAKPLEQVKTMLKQEVTQKFWQVADGGAEIELAPGQSVVIETTHNAILEMNRLVARLSGGGTQKAVTRSGVRVEFDGTTAQAIQQAIENRQAQAYAREYDLHEAIDQAASVEAALQIDTDSGWPPVPERS